MKFYCKTAGCNTVSEANSTAQIAQLGKLCASCRSARNRESLVRKPLVKLKVTGSWLCLGCGVTHRGVSKPYRCGCMSHAFKFQKDTI